MKLPVLLFVVFCTAVLMAFEDLGPLKAVQNKYPQIFKTGSVNIITINNIPCYVFSGEAEQAFSGDFAETESELYEEATLSAKSNFYEYFSEKNKNTVISMTGCKVLYRYNDKKQYTVILCVPRENVTIKTNTPVPVEKHSALPGQFNELKQEKSPVKETKTPSVSQNVNDVPVSRQSSQERRIKKFENRINNNPDDIIALISLADLHKKSGNLSAAIKFYRRAIKKLEKDEFFDEAEKIRVIYTLACLCEKTNKNNMSLKYYHYLLRHKCSIELKKKVIAAISRLKLKTLD